jgi:hypothetical protein
MAVIRDMPQRRARTTRLAADARYAKTRCFVGREPELAAFRAIAASTDRALRVLAVCGAMGIGKSALLREMAQLCTSLGIPHVWVHGEDRPTPQQIEATLTEGRVGDAPSTSARAILIDDADLIDPVALPFLLPALPERSIVVVTSQVPLPDRVLPAGLDTSQWQQLVLRPLDQEAAEQFLAEQDVPEREWAAIQGFADGYPSALARLAARSAEKPEWEFDPRYELAIIKDLADRLQPPNESPEQGRALEAAAIVHSVTEDLLEHVLEAGETAPLFDWLARLPYMRAQSTGLYMEPYARNILGRNMMWRRPDRRTEVVRRARLYFWNRFRRESGYAQEWSMFSLQFMRRSQRVPVRLWDVEGLEVTSMRPEDHDQLVALHRSYGELQGELAKYWFSRQPDGVSVVRRRSGEIVGFIAVIQLNFVDEDDRAIDPGIDAACRFIEQTLLLHSGEPATYVRFWVSGEAAHTFTPTESLLRTRMYLSFMRPGLVYSIVSGTEASPWGDSFRTHDFATVPEAGFVIDGRSYLPFGHDWRAVPVADWLETTSLLPQTELASVWRNRSRMVFDEDDFRRSLHDALSDFHTPAALGGNPLLRSRLLLDHVQPDASVEERIEALRQLMLDAIDRVPNSAKVLRAGDLLRWTYIEPQGTQRQVAQLLNLPFSTYRNHLAKAHEILSRQLWAQEAAPFVTRT